MLVIGPRHQGPEVQDTTAEQLSRQAEELRQERARAQAEIAALRTEREADLRRRQAAIDHAERELIRTEQRLRRRGANTAAATTSGRASGATTSHSSNTGPDTTSSRPSWFKSKGTPIATLVAAALILLATLGAWSAQGHSEEFAKVDSLSRSLTAFQYATVLLDADVLAHLDEGPIAGLDQAEGQEETAALLRATEVVHHAQEIYPGERPYDPTRMWDAQAFSLLRETSPTKVRAVALWEDLRMSADNAMGRYEVSRALDEIGGPAAALLGWGTVALVVLVCLTVVVFRARRPLTGGLLSLAIVLVVTMMITGSFTTDSEFDARSEAHLETLDDLRLIAREQGRDLELALGTETYYFTREVDYWERAEPGEQERQEMGELGQAQAQARHELGRTVLSGAGLSEVISVSAAYAHRGLALFEEHLPAAEHTRASLMELAPGSPIPPALPLGLGIGATLLTAAVLVRPSQPRRSDS